MSHPLLEAATALADTLMLENAALDAMDLGRAAGMLEAKQAAAKRFAEIPATPPPPAREAAAAITRVRGLADENKRLLERAIATQARVLKIVIGAATPTEARPSQYGAAGTLARPAYTSPVALSARA